MKLQSQITAALVGTTLLATSAVAGNQSPNFAEMIDAATTSYAAIDSSAFSTLEANVISTRILAISQLPMNASPMSIDGQLFFRSASDNTAMLHVDGPGRTVVFHKGIGDINGAESTPNLPSKEAAPAVAQGVLAELELTPERTEEMFVEHVGGLSMGLESPTGDSQVFEKLRTVRFGRRLGGQRVIGRGSRIQVQLGQEGELRGVIRRWDEVSARSIAPEAKFTAPEIREMIRFRLDNSANHAKAIAFNKAELVLFDDGQGVIEPVIHVVVDLTIESQTRGEDGTPETRVIENPFDFFVPILRNPKAELPYAKDQQLAHEVPADAR